MRNSSISKVILASAALACGAIGAQTLMASSVQVVPPSTTPCVTGPPIYPTITLAVNSVFAGSTIFVCPGTYAEQVVITKKLNLTGVSSNGTNGPSASGADNPVVTSPAGGVVQNTTSLATGNPIAAQILVGGTNPGVLTGVAISNITVDGSNNLLSGCGAAELIGIFYQNASGTINHVATRHQRLDTADNGCQNGLGIFVQSGNSLTSTVTIENSSVHSYQKNGITGNEVGTNVTITNNYVVGQGSTTGAAENGIQIGFGGTGKVSGNTVMDDLWAPDTISDPGDAASGILIYGGGSTLPGSGGITIGGNVVGSAQFSIALIDDTFDGFYADGSTITTNRVLGTQIFDAIDVCANNNTVSSNTVFASDESALHLDSSCGGTGNGNTINKNTLNETCAGVLEGSGTSGNLLGTGTNANSFYNVGSTTLNADICSSPVFGATGGSGLKGRTKNRGPRPAPARP
ncbi:MAG TPA: hypothetical protein VG206_14875 [Terriglobia bacterium]|nr:hypothetical protein [Terriglobia bacterium]